MRFTIDDKHLLRWMWVKKLRRKTLAQDVFWQKMKAPHWSNYMYQWEIFNFVDLCSRVGIVWSITTRTRVSDATAVIFSVKCFKAIKTLSSVSKHLQKVVCFIPFIYSRAFNNNVISNGKSYCCNDNYWHPVYIAASNEYLTRIQIICHVVKISILLAILCEIFIQIDYFI